jgi:hypothetical protein
MGAAWTSETLVSYSTSQLHNTRPGLTAFIQTLSFMTFKVSLSPHAKLLPSFLTIDRFATHSEQACRRDKTAQ